MTAFRQCLDKDNNTHVTVRYKSEDKGECDIVALSDGLSQFEQYYFLTCGYYADEIYLHKSAGNIRFAEIVILGKGLNFKI